MAAGRAKHEAAWGLRKVPWVSDPMALAIIAICDTDDRDTWWKRGLKKKGIKFDYMEKSDVIKVRSNFIISNFSYALRNLKYLSDTRED